MILSSAGKMTFDDPWDGISVPVDMFHVSARRVGLEGRWNFYWGRSYEGYCLLLMRCSSAVTTSPRMPDLRGMFVSLSSDNDSPSCTLSITLTESGNRDIFLQFCNDIMHSTSSCSTEVEAVSRVIAQTWRWHYLLREGRSLGLSVAEQRGLIGELLVIDQLLLPSLGAHVAIEAWMGPFGAPKDFEWNRVAIEVKTKRGADRSIVSISSEHQLDSAGCDSLFLYVVDLDSSSELCADSFSLIDLVRRITEKLSSNGYPLIGRFEAALASVGFDFRDEYSLGRWVIEPPRLSWRLQQMRRWSHDEREDESIFA